MNKMQTISLIVGIAGIVILLFVVDTLTQCSERRKEELRDKRRADIERIEKKTGCTFIGYTWGTGFKNWICPDGMNVTD